MIVFLRTGYFDAVTLEAASFEGFFQIRNALLQFFGCIDAIAFEWHQRAGFDEERTRLLVAHRLEPFELNRGIMVKHSFIDFEMHFPRIKRARQRFPFGFLPLERRGLSVVERDLRS